MTVTLLWLWKIQLTMIGKSPVVQEPGWLGKISMSTMPIETEQTKIGPIKLAN